MSRKEHDQDFQVSQGTMKKRLEENHHHQDLEVLKAVAQAWYSHSGSVRPMTEFDARRRNFKGNHPSRFKLEALNKNTRSPAAAAAAAVDTTMSTYCWDFEQSSLWDPYELVTVSRRIETGLAFDNPFDNNFCGSPLIQSKRKKESKNSLRNLFNNMSSRRFNSPKLPQDKY